jgi:hypothetical protein
MCYLRINLLLLLVLVVKGTHFLGGTVTWRLLNASATGTPIDVIITQTYLWTYTDITCTNNMIATNQLIPLTASYLIVGMQTLNCTSNCASGATGYSPIPVQSRCTDISSTIDVTAGQRSDTRSLAAGDDFDVAYQAASWRGLATGANLAWSILSHIDLTPRPDNGLYNNAPVATMMSPINIVQNKPTTINVPVGDSDGDDVRCRWANNSECANVCPPSSLPANTTIYPNCTIIITGKNIGDWFAVTVMVRYVIFLSK